MEICIIALIAYLMTKILKWEHTSSYLVFCGAMMVLCAETRLLFFIFAIIVQVQVEHLKQGIS